MRPVLFVLIVLALGAAAYLTAIAFNVFDRPLEVRRDTADQSQLLDSAKLVGDTSIKGLSARWDEAALKRMLDPSTHATEWYKTLEGMLPIYREDYGEILDIASTVKAVPSQPGASTQLFDYHGRAVCQKKDAKVRILIARSRNGWAILGLEIMAAPKEDGANSDRAGDAKG